MRFPLWGSVRNLSSHHGSGDPLREVVLVGYYPPPLGGESVHVKQLAHRLHSEGFRVHVINSRRGAPPSPEYRNVSGPLDFIHALLESLSPGSTLHLHTNGHSTKSWLMIIAAAVVLRLRRARGVLTLHSGLAPGYVARMGALPRYVLRLGVAPFSQIICVNAQIREVLVGLGVRDSRLSVIPAYLGVPAPAPLPKEDARLIEGFSPLVAAVGAADPEYGLPLLVEAICGLRKGLPGIGCVVMGSGGNAELQGLIDRLGLTDRVRCAGEILHERYISLLSRADVFVRPTYADGDAVSVREALALGVPVVASDTDFRPPDVTLFRRGDSNDLAIKISQALDGPHKLERRAQVNTSDSVERLLAIYRRLDNSAMLQMIRA